MNWSILSFHRQKPSATYVHSQLSLSFWQLGLCGNSLDQLLLKLPSVALNLKIFEYVPEVY